MAALWRCARGLVLGNAQFKRFPQDVLRGTLSRVGECRALASCSLVNREWNSVAQGMMSRKWLVDFYWEPRENGYRLTRWHCLCPNRDCRLDENPTCKANIDIILSEQEDDSKDSYDDKQGVALCSYEGLMLIRLRKSHKFRLLLGDPLANTWTRLPEAPFKAFSATFAEDGSHTLLIGAIDGRLATYSFVDNTWTIHVAQASEKTLSSQIVWVDGAFYAIYGWCLATWKPNGTNQTWRTIRCATCFGGVPGSKLHVVQSGGKLLVCVENFAAALDGMEWIPKEVFKQNHRFYEVDANGDKDVELTTLLNEVNTGLLKFFADLECSKYGIRFGGKDDLLFWTEWSTEIETYLTNEDKEEYDPYELFLGFYYSREEGSFDNFCRVGRTVTSYLSVCYHVSCRSPVTETLLKSLKQTKC